MNSYQLINAVEALLSSLTDDNYLLSTLAKSDQTYDSIVKNTTQLIASDNTTIKNTIEGTQTILTKTIDEYKALSPSKLCVAVDKLSNDLLHFRQTHASNFEETLDILSKEINQFLTNYEEFLKKYDISEVFRLILAAKNLYSSIIVFKDTLIFIKQNLQMNIETPDKDTAILSILLTANMDFAEFILKLNSIKVIYYELAHLLNISITEYPIRIAKIESGSLWAKIFGSSRIIDLMVNLLESFIGFVYRNFTKEGKIRAIPQNLKSIEAIIELTAKLDQEGVNTSELKEHISKASVAIVKELKVLLSGQPVVEINDKRFSVGKTLEEQYLQESRMLMLESGDTSEPESISEAEILTK